MASSVRWVAAVVIVAFCCCSAANAQIIMLKQDGDKRIQCMHTGLSSDLKDCGTQSDWYAYVFVGTISAVTPTKGSEKELHIIPDEVFKGEPTNPVIVLTSQGACFPEIRAGNHWLFYLLGGNPIVLDYYGNVSRPVADAQQQLETLRRLGSIGENGILRGRVMQGPFGERNSIPNAHIVAHRTSDDEQFVATTDADGRYEFQPLPPGSYKINVDPVGSFRPDESGVDMKSRACWDLTLSRSPHAQLGGHLQHSDRSATAQVPVLIMTVDERWFTTQKSNPQGYFRFDSLAPGKYVVAINLSGAPKWQLDGCAGACKDRIPAASMYYPNMQNRADAITINLATDEKRDDIDFALPVQ
jgi:carboxypeptidase family protein